MSKAVRILIVDDVDEMRVLMAEVIANLPGLHVSGQAANTIEARLELDRRRPDLILLDEVLPGESSLDFLSEILQEKIPVILVTSLEDPQSPISPGVLGRLKKPHWKDTSLFEKELLDLAAMR